MNQKELTKIFMMISNWKQPFDLRDLYKNNSALSGLRANCPKFDRQTVLIDIPYI